MLLEREERGLEAHDYNQLLLSGMRVRGLCSAAGCSIALLHIMAVHICLHAAFDLVLHKCCAFLLLNPLDLHHLNLQALHSIMPGFLAAAAGAPEGVPPEPGAVQPGGAGVRARGGARRPRGAVGGLPAGAGLPSEVSTHVHLLQAWASECCLFSYHVTLCLYWRHPCWHVRLQRSER